MNRLLSFLLPAVICLLLSGCVASRRHKSSCGLQSADVAENLRQSALDINYIALVNSYQPKWECVEMPLSVKATGLPFTLSGSAFMQRDRSLALSLRMLGMEVMSAQITNDTLVVVDRYHGRHLMLPLEEVISGFPVTIGNIQDLLIGRAFIVGMAELPDEVDNQLFTITSESELKDEWFLLPNSENLPFNYGFKLNAVPELLALGIDIRGKRSAKIEYSPLAVLTPYGRLASEVDLKLLSGDNEAMNVRLQWRPDKARWNGDARSRKVTIPTGSKAMDATSLLKSLGGSSQ